MNTIEPDSEMYISEPSVDEEPNTQIIEDNLEDDLEEIIPFKYSITSYGADYPVDGLVKRIKQWKHIYSITPTWLCLETRPSFTLHRVTSAWSASSRYIPLKRTRNPKTASD